MVGVKKIDSLCCFPGGTMIAMSTTLTVRTARPTDDWALARLAGLDSARPLTGEVILAEAEGRPVAAISVTDGRVVADPFQTTTETVAVLRMRAAQLRATPAAATRKARRMGLRAATG